MLPTHKLSIPHNSVMIHLFAEYLDLRGEGHILQEADSSCGFVMCSWCQKPGVKLYTLKTGCGDKAFCSEQCFTLCRRASFKKNKVCDWCKHVRHTVSYMDFQVNDGLYVSLLTGILFPAITFIRHTLFLRFMSNLTTASRI